MKLSEYIPLGFQIILEPYEEEVKTKSGLFLPSNGVYKDEEGTAIQEKPLMGKILRVGSMTKENFSEGDIVLLPPVLRNGIELTFEDNKKVAFSINSHDVLGIVRKAQPTTFE